MRIRKVSSAPIPSVSGAVVDSLSGSSTTNAPSVRAVNDRNTYSTDEKIIGYWIDGKPIYRRVISGVYQSGTTLVSNVSTLIHAYGCGDVGTGAIRTIPYYEIYDNRVYLLDIRKNGNNVIVNAQNNGSSASTSSGTNIIIEYTKTTD